MALSPPPDHWLPGFNFNVEECDASGQTYETLAITAQSSSVTSSIRQKVPADYPLIR